MEGGRESDLARFLRVDALEGGLGRGVGFCIGFLRLRAWVRSRLVFVIRSVVNIEDLDGAERRPFDL